MISHMNRKLSSRMIRDIVTDPKINFHLKNRIYFTKFEV